MKITCPNCTASYEVPEAVLAAKRAVRCARCGNNWVPEAEGEVPAAPDAGRLAEMQPAPVAPDVAPAAAAASAVLDAAPEADLPAAKPPAPTETNTTAQSPVSPQPEPASVAVDRRVTPDADTAAPRTKAPVAAWIASVALLLVLVLSAIAFRGAIMKSWPPSQRLYAAVGLYHR